METLKRWYIIVSVVAFTFCMPVFGRTPAGWVLGAVSWIAGHAPRSLPSPSLPPSTAN